jgi:2-methylisocitrate lyase-like PEP mutase family enzyme
VTRDEAIAHARTLVEAVDIPVSADLENGFADDPDDVAVTVGMAIEAGLAGCSIEDYSRDPNDPIYDLELATDRIAAAAKAAHDGGLVLTARAENHLHGRDNLADTIARLEAYELAGADVVYAPGPTDAGQLAAIVKAVRVPVNVLVRKGSPTVTELRELGVARISVGGAFAFAAYGTLIEAATELRDVGTYGFTEQSAIGARAAREAFDS